MEQAGYSSFSLKMVKQRFDLTEKKQAIFDDIPLFQPSDLLLKTLERGRRITTLNNEKSRSEFIVAPILSEIADLNLDKISFFSGENLDVDKAQDLTGECDYIFTLVPESSTIETPILCLVEAENDNLATGLGQCVAQMLGAQGYNLKDDVARLRVYGCVTTGYDWQFLALEGKTIIRNPNVYLLDNLPVIMGMMQTIIEKG